MKIYKSCTAGLSDKQFELTCTSGLTTFISFARLMRNTIGSQLRKNERIVGMVIDHDGIQLYLENIK
jgi:hypothetical protein